MENNNYCVLSQELLVLFQWFCTHKPHLVQEMLTKAWSQGLAQKFNAIQSHNESITEDNAHDIMINFFTLLEDSIAEIEAEQDQNIEGNASQIDDTHSLKINLQDCDQETLSKTYQKLQNGQKDLDHNKETFLHEFLKNWKSKSNLVQ